MGACCSELLYKDSTSEAETAKKQMPRKKKQREVVINRIALIQKTAPKLELAKNGLLASRKEVAITRSISNISTEDSPDSIQRSFKQQPQKNFERCRSLGPLAFQSDVRQISNINDNQQAKERQIKEESRVNRNKHCYNKN